ncbi:type II toxin-antitoxin system RelE/ParE family toxin [Pseudomonas piscis]|uniref:type II toxin-antitoxin system RelE/ParE family toxin n=1 Tax=Pseudomonas piscis TaxID=2614538 RepID=UPI0038510AD4
MARYRIADTARSDIVDALRFSQKHFGEQARIRYQDLLLGALQDLAAAPLRLGSHERNELARGLRSYHLLHSRRRSQGQSSLVKRPRHILFYRVIDNDLIEVIRLLHDAMDAQSQLQSE